LCEIKDLQAEKRISLSSKFLRPSPDESMRPAPPARGRRDNHLKKNSTAFVFSETQTRGREPLPYAWLAEPAFSPTGGRIRGGGQSPIGDMLGLMPKLGESPGERRRRLRVDEETPQATRGAG
jgi:hypothetical protein